MAAVSVLIPCKGDSPYLLETLISIYSNTLLPDEVIIINDGMDSKTIEAIDIYSKNNKIRIIDNIGNGLVDALNTGINASNHELILRIDSDDLMEKDRIKIQLDFMNQNPATVVLGSQCTLIDKFGRTIGKTNYPTGELNKLWKFSSSCQLAHPSVIMKKSIVKSAGGYRKIFNCNNMDIAEDFDLWLRMAKLGSIQNLKSSLTKYRQHENQLSSKYSSAQILATLYVSSNLSSSLRCEIKTDPELVFTDYSGYLKVLRKQKNRIVKLQHSFLLKKVIAKENRKYFNLIFSKIISKLMNVILDLNQIFVLAGQILNFSTKYQSK